MAARTPEQEQKHAEWRAACEEEIVAKPFLYDQGVLSMPAILQESLAMHLQLTVQDGFVYNEAPHYRSFMEAVYMEKLRQFSTDAWRLRTALITQLDGVLQQVIEGSEPKPGKVDLRVIASTEHILPVAKLLRVLTHPMSVPADVDMVWNFFEKLWCIGHPKGYHSGHLLLLEDQINARFDELEDRLKEPIATTALDIMDFSG